MAISLGDINFGIGPDTRALDAAIGRVRAFGQAVNAAVGTQAAGAYRKQEQATVNAINTTARYIAQAQRLQAPQAFIDRYAAGLNRISMELNRGARDTLAYQRAMEAFRTDVARTNREVALWARQMKLAENSISGSEKIATGFRSMANAAVLINGPLGGVASRLSVLSTMMTSSSLAMAAFAGGIATAAAGVALFTKEAIRLRKEMDPIIAQFEATSKSADDVRSSLIFTRRVADLSGQTFLGVAESFAKMNMAVKGTELEGEKFRDMFTQLNMVAGKFQWTTDKTQGVMRAFEQMLSKGVAQAEELRGQLGDRLAGAFTIAAEAMGMTTQQLNQAMEAGEVLAVDFVPKMIAALSEIAKVDVSKPIDSLVASENRMRNAWEGSIRALDQLIGSTDAYKNAITAIGDALQFTESIFLDWDNGWLMVTTSLRLQAWETADEIAKAFVELIIRCEVLMQQLPSIFKAAFADAAIEALYYIEQVGNAIAKLTGGEVTEYIKFEPMKNSDAAWEETLQRMEERISSIADYMAANPIFSGEIEDARRLAEEAKKAFEAIKTEREKLDFSPINNAAQELMPNKKAIRQQMGIDEAIESIRDLQDELNAMSKGDQALLKFKRELEITDAVDTFRDKLTRLGLAQEKINELTEQYATILRSVKEAQWLDEDTINDLELLADKLGNGMTDAMDKVIDAFFEGSNAAEAFKEVVRATLRDIVKEAWQLVLINPLKNFMFGTNEPVMGGGAGTGGILGTFADKVYDSLGISRPTASPAAPSPLTAVPSGIVESVKLPNLPSGAIPIISDNQVQLPNNPAVLGTSPDWMSHAGAPKPPLNPEGYERIPGAFDQFMVGRPTNRFNESWTHFTEGEVSWVPGGTNAEPAMVNDPLANDLAWIPREGFPTGLPPVPPTFAPGSPLHSVPQSPWLTTPPLPADRWTPYPSMQTTPMPAVQGLESSLETFNQDLTGVLGEGVSSTGSVMQAFTSSLGGALGGAPSSGGGLFGGLLGMFSPTPAPMPLVPIAHGGGLVGSTNFPMVPTSGSWSGVPKFDKGLLPGEMKAIVHDGEAILNPEQLSSYAAANQAKGKRSRNQPSKLSLDVKSTVNVEGAVGREEMKAMATQAGAQAVESVKRNILDIIDNGKSRY